MKAAFIRQTGSPEKIIYGDLPTPKPEGKEVLIRVQAVSVNPIDTYVRGGLVKVPLPDPYVIGADLAGTVEEIGPEVSRFKTGDQVWGCVWSTPIQQGSFSEYVRAGEEWLYPLPDAVSHEDAASVALVGITAHLGLVREANLRPGETLFVNGGSGGVGSVVVQMGKALGAKVIATVGSPQKANRCTQLGASVTINYKRENVASALKDHCPAGVQVWFEMTRTPDLELAVQSLARGGRIVLIAGREAKSIFPVGPFYVKNCRMNGFQMTLATPEERQVCAKDMNRWMTEGFLKSQIDRILPLSEARAAHRLQEENTIQNKGTLSGKIVLKT
jgi:NADPH2:quinone reductase